MNGINNIITGAQKAQLLAIKQSQRSLNVTQEILSTGKDVNSAIQDPQSFFLSRSLGNRAADLIRLLDGIGQSIQTVNVADHGVTSILKLLDEAEAFLTEADQELTYTDNELSATIVPADDSEIQTYGAGQDANDGTLTVDSDDASIFFDGNFWKRYDQSITITEDTILRFEYQSTNIPEMSVIGFDTDTSFANDSNRFYIYGIQTIGLTYAAPTNTFEYDGSGDLVTIEIPVGEYFTGTFTNIVFIHDDDGGGDDGDALFQNITLFEDGEDGPQPDDLERTIEIEEEYAVILEQIDRLAQDASYRGIGLLVEETLTTFFNETYTSSLAIEGINATSNGLGLTQKLFREDGKIDTALDQIREAKDILRGYGTTLSNDLNILKNRLDFSRSSINTLEAGRDDLIVADMNRFGAEQLALQTRQQIQFQVLNLTKQTILDFL